MVWTVHSGRWGSPDSAWQPKRKTRRRAHRHGQSSRDWDPMLNTWVLSGGRTNCYTPRQCWSIGAHGVDDGGQSLQIHTSKGQVRGWVDGRSSADRRRKVRLKVRPSGRPGTRCILEALGVGRVSVTTYWPGYRGRQRVEGFDSGLVSHFSQDQWEAAELRRIKC